MVREAGKEDAHHLDQTPNVKRINNETPHDQMSPREIDEMIETLQVMKLEKAERYSNQNQTSNPCNRCSTEHQTGRCPANGKTWFNCGGKNHFAREPACPNKRPVKKISSDYFATLQKETNLAPEEAKPVRKIHTPPDRWVNVKIGGTAQTLYADTDSEYTIITPKH